MLHDTTDSPIVTWPCYEPAGHRIELTEADLVQHVLLLGSTGSGKSTLLTAATSQLILHRAEKPEDKIGLLLLDAKADDLVPRVRSNRLACKLVISGKAPGNAGCSIMAETKAAGAG
jgi:energy-coupling factor transporter ATP-binding protein EcfA2